MPMTVQTEQTAEAPFDARALRMILAAERVTRRRFARACGLEESYTSRLLNGHKEPGEIARLRIARGLHKLGLSLDTHGDGNYAA